MIAVSTKDRSPLVPDVPTVAEQGFPGYDVVSWYGLLAPTGTPRSVITFLHKEVGALLQTEDITKQLQAVGATPAPSKTPEEFGAYLRSEIAIWAKVIKRAGITSGEP